MPPSIQNNARDIFFRIKTRVRKHRVHLPVISNDGVAFFVGGEAGTAENAVTLETMIKRAHQMHQAGHVDKAESLYRQVVHFNTDHVVGNNLLGLLYLQTNRNEEAVAHIQSALSVAPCDAQTHANLGLALKNLNRLEEAAKHFQESLKLAPNNPRPYSNLGSIYIALGHVRESLPYFQHALSIQPESPEVHFNLGNALLHLQEFAPAVSSLEQCLALKPDFPGARDKLVLAVQGLSDA